MDKYEDKFRYTRGSTFREYIASHVPGTLREVRGFHVQRGKYEIQNVGGCPILSQAIGNEKLRTVFVFAVAHLEGPPPGLHVLQWGYRWKNLKNQFLAIKSARSVLQ